MGNTPTQEPVDGEPAGGGEPAAGTSLSERLGGLARRVAGGIRARLSVFSDLDLGAAFGVVDEERLDQNRGDREEPRLPACTGTSNSVTSVSVDGLPARRRPFTEPADASNDSELRARKRNGQLSIYYPDRPETAITSDTWERVER